MEERIKKLIEEMEEISSEIEGGDYWNVIDKATLTQLQKSSKKIGSIAFYLKEGI